MSGKLCRVLLRKRVYEPDQLVEGNLKRCLSTWDLTALGVGSSLGVGVYVLVGAVALQLAGPAVVLSFLVAAVAAIVAGMCYAELGSRVPKAGSAYIYAYVTAGEIVAFVVGWLMILETVFGAASVARGLSMYVDSLTNSTMSTFFQSFASINSAHLSLYFDFFSFFLVLLIGVMLMIGVREASLINSVVTGVSVLIILFVIFAGAFKVDTSNWSIPSEVVPGNGGDGGFFPHGVWGMLKGAAVCFYGFVGFDSISYAGEEVRDPGRAIPVSIMCTQVIVFLLYSGVAIVLTMMMPYYLQDSVAAIATAFTYVGLEWAWYIATAGAVVGITASLYGCVFPVPRLLYAMASDGLLFHWLGKVTSRQNPLIATLLSTVVIAILAGILELNELILMLSIGTLLTYTIVASCVIVLRYRSCLTSTNTSFVKLMLGVGHKAPTKNTTFIIYLTLMLFICTCLSNALVVHHMEQSIVYNGILHGIALILVVVMALQPQVKEELAFKTPLVPFVPCLSIYVNIHLMVLIKLQTWIRVLIWIAIGIPIYILCVCCYKQKADNNLGEGIESTIHANVNGKPAVQIYVVSPTPPDTISRSSKGDESLQRNNQIQEIKLKEDVVINKIPFVTEEVIVQHAYYEDNEEKEAKIIDLLDQVIQAEEDSYGEIISLKDHEDRDEEIVKEQKTHRKSLSELSDAGSDASLGNQVLSKYDVIAQVHREDLPKVNEEEERSDRENDEIIEHEEITAFNDNDSRTDESGYSDTIDKTALNDSIDDLKDDDLKEDIPIIPIPPPLDEKFFASPDFMKAYNISARSSNNKHKEKETKPPLSVMSNTFVDDKQDVSTIPIPPPMDENYFAIPLFKKSFTVSARASKSKQEEEDNKPRISVLSNTSAFDKKDEKEDVSTIPIPPPLDENFFASPTFKKSYTISSRPSKSKNLEEDENKPRTSVLSKTSAEDTPMVFGSDKQMDFMSKLNNIFQSKIALENEDDVQRQRSYSTGNVVEDTELETIRRPALFLDLKKEITSREAAQNLRHVNVDDSKSSNTDEEEGDTSLSREDLKSKLENIFAAGGPKPMKNKVMKSNPPTPEEPYQTDTSGSDSDAKMPKMEKNDTLKRQKTKFGDVLNSFKMTLNKEDVV